MTQACCPSCRVRFSRASAAQFDACPHCALPLDRTAGPADVIGYRLFDIADPVPALPAAVAQAIAKAMPIASPPHEHR
jgi:hypothetical protein